MKSSIMVEAATKMAKTWVAMGDIEDVRKFGGELIQILPPLLDDNVSVDSFIAMLTEILKDANSKHTTK